MCLRLALSYDVEFPSNSHRCVAGGSSVPKVMLRTPNNIAHTGPLWRSLLSDQESPLGEQRRGETRC